MFGIALETALYVCSGTFWKKIVLKTLLLIFMLFRTLERKFSEFELKFIRQSRLNFFSGVSRKILDKNEKNCKQITIFRTLGENVS